MSFRPCSVKIAIRLIDTIIVAIARLLSMTEGIRFAEMTGAIARAADVGIGFPPETSLRLCLVAVGLARAVGISDEETRDVYQRHFCATPAARPARTRRRSSPTRSSYVAQSLWGTPASRATCFRGS
jgi:hypothetical protein